MIAKHDQGFDPKFDSKNRKRRQERGNWKGSLGEFIATNREDIDKAYQNKNIISYMKTVAEEQLEGEAQQYTLGLLRSHLSNDSLYKALYDIMLKGEGYGMKYKKKSN